MSRSNVTKAVVLSAGQGKRLLPLTASVPKCLLLLTRCSLLEWQLRSLNAAGITEAVVVTGFQAGAVERALHDIAVPGLTVRTLFNPFYAVSDNIGSCYVARHEMIGNLLLLNGDTIFEPAVLEAALSGSKRRITVTIDHKPRYDADDMKVQLAGDRVRAIGKALGPESTDAESIGLIVFRGDGAERFAAGVEAVLRAPDGIRKWYLSVIDGLARAGEAVGTVSIDGLDWQEVDVPGDLAKAVEMTRLWSIVQPLDQRARPRAWTGRI